MTDDPKFILTPFKFPMLTFPSGHLPSDMRAQACWYFYVLAEEARRAIGHDTESQFGLLDENLWMDLRYESQAKAVATLYGLESPSEFAKFWPHVKRQASSMGYPKPADEYVRLKAGRDKDSIT